MKLKVLLACLALTGCSNAKNSNNTNSIKWNDIENKEHVIGNSESSVGLAKINIHTTYSPEPHVFEVYYDSIPFSVSFDLCAELQKYKKSCPSKLSISKSGEDGYNLDIELNYLVAEIVAEINLPSFKEFSYNGIISKGEKLENNRKEITFKNDKGESVTILQNLDVIEIISL